MWSKAPVFTVRTLRSWYLDSTYASVESATNDAVQPVCWCGYDIEPSLSPHSPPQRERSTSPKSASFFETLHTPRQCARETNTKSKKLVKGVQKLVRTRQTPKAVSADVHRDLDENLEPIIFIIVEQNAMEV